MADAHRSFKGQRRLVGRYRQAEREGRDAPVTGRVDERAPWVGLYLYWGEFRFYTYSETKSETRQKVHLRVKRIAGQVAGIQRMVEEDRYCIDILNQVAAVRSALDAFGVELLHQHIEGCVLGQGSGREYSHATPMSREELLAELQKAIARFVR